MALSRVRRVVFGCTRAMAVAAMVVIALMMLTITYDVLARFLLAAPTDWAYPLNSAGVLVATMLAVPHLWATGRHIAMDLVHRALPPAVRRVADAVTVLAGCFLGVVLAVSAIRSTVVDAATGLTGAGTFGVPFWIPDAVLALSGVFLVLAALLFPPAPPDAPPAAVPGDPVEAVAVADEHADEQADEQAGRGAAR